MLFNFVCQINATTEQAKVFSRSSLNNYCQSRWRCLDLIDISCGLRKLNKGYTVPYSFKMGQHFWGPKKDVLKGTLKGFYGGGGGAV